MLIYNFQKEFIGIDESDLQVLGFENLEVLRAEAADFADFFVRTPGFVHNFKHMHWIDYIACAESLEESKAIIHTSKKDFKCNLDIKIVYLVDNPSAKAYSIDLVNLRPISSDELAQVKKDIEQKPVAEATTQRKELFQGQDLDKQPLSTPEIVEKSTTPIQEITIESTKVQEDKNKLEEIAIETYEEEHIREDVIDLPIEEEKEEDKIEITLDIPDEREVAIAPIIKAPKKEKKKKKSKEKKVALENIYTYNPQVASDELGLPIDLIEEFLEDFIAQANEFRNKLYKALDEGDIKNAKALSHKLKGVAANLRIEDAFEVLAIANTSENLQEIQTNIDKFYQIMSKLSISNNSEEEEEIPSPLEKTKEDDSDDDDYDDDLFINFDEEKHTEAEEVSIDNKSQETTANEIEYDKISVAKEIGIDTKFFDELLTDFVNDSSILINSINEDINKNNPQSWKKNTQTLKGMSENMRVKHYAQDLSTLLSTDDTEIAKESINNISLVLKQISNI